MGKQGASSSQRHPDNTNWISFKHNLVYAIYEGAMHNVLTQVEVSSYGFPLLYSYEFPSVNGTKVQRNSLMRVRYPEDDNDDDDNASAVVFGLMVALSIVSLLLIATCVFLFMQRSHMLDLQKRVDSVTLLPLQGSS